MSYVLFLVENLGMWLFYDCIPLTPVQTLQRISSHHFDHILIGQKHIKPILKNWMLPFENDWRNLNSIYDMAGSFMCKSICH